MVQFSKAYWLVLGLMVATFAVNVWLRAPKITDPVSIDLQFLPAELKGWNATEQAIAERVVHVLKTDQALLRHYQDSTGRRVEFFLGYFQDQQFGAQAHSPLHCLPGAGWTILRHEKLALPNLANISYASKLLIAKEQQQQLVVYWFYSGGKIVQNEFELKWRLLLNALRHRSTSVYFYRIGVLCGENEESQAMEIMQMFLVSMVPYLERR